MLDTIEAQLKGFLCVLSALCGKIIFCPSQKIHRIDIHGQSNP